MANSLRNVAIGRFFQSSSLMHRMDARFKFLFIILLMIYVGVSSSNYSLMFIGLLSIIVGILSRVPAMILIKGLKPFLFLFIFTFLFHLFLTPGRPISLYFVGSIGMTYEGFYHGILIDYRLMALIYLSSILTLTTTPEHMVNAIEWYLKPFEMFGFPARSFSMMILISLKFMPILFQEISKIVCLYRREYNNSEKWSLFFSINKIAELFLPVLINSFHRAEKLAEEIDTRGFEAIEKI